MRHIQIIADVTHRYSASFRNNLLRFLEKSFPVNQPNRFVTSVIILLCINITVAFSQGNLYQYPITPESAEWRSLSTTQERINACNIPQFYIDNANTTDLLISCLSNPLLFEITASNSFLTGMNNLRAQAKAFQILSKRSDYKRTLLDYYALTNPKAIMYITDSLSQLKYSLQYLYVELMLADRVMVQSLTDQELKSLAKQLLTKFEQKSQLFPFG